MPLYESTFIARQDISQADVTKLTEGFSDVVKEKGGKVVKNEYWGLRSLAYRINKNRKGHYSFLGIDAPADAIKEMERKMGLSEDIIRTLTIKVDAIDEEPSAILQQQSSGRYDDDDKRGGRRGGPRDRDDRGPRGDRGDRGPRPDRNSDRADTKEAKSTDSDKE